MRQEKAPGKGKPGFTLLEVMVVVGFLAILAALAVPSYLTWLPKYRLKSAATELVANFQKAKLEAVRRNTSVVVSLTPGIYTMSGQNGGYQVFVDDGAGIPANAGNDVRDAGEILIAQVTMPINVSLTAVNFSLGSTTPGYNSRGLPLRNRIGNIQIRNAETTYRIVMSAAGNINIQ